MPKKIESTEKVYIKDSQCVLIDKEGLFVYESSVYLHHKNYFGLCGKEYYSSLKEIKGVVKSFFKTSQIEICSELYSAPEQWLIDSGYVEYIKLDKKIKPKPKIKNENK